MSVRSVAMMVSVSMVVPLGGAIAQAVDPIAPLPAPGLTVPTPLPVPPTTPAVVPPAIVLPPPLWQADDAVQLLAAIRASAKEGLNPADYDPAGLDAALRSNNSVALSAAATDRFNKLASDYALGHVRREARVDWHVSDPDLSTTSRRALLDQALASQGIAAALAGLLPSHPQYGALRYALDITPATETAKVNRIRLNMDRWRWLPRDLGAKYIIVNVPSFHATLVENGVTRWKHKAIAGAIKTPTPQLNAMATGVILNPWWEVPTSISKEVAGKGGFVPVKGKDGKVQRWRQPPGPTNALGQLKFVMQNPYAIYLHDTNARSRFNSSVRALSHGCIRTEKVLDLAGELLGDDNGEWTQEKIQAALDSKTATQANFVKPLPVYIVYFSSAALVDGKIQDYEDVYKRDARTITALLNRDGKGPAVAKPAAAPGKKVTAR